MVRILVTASDLNLNPDFGLYSCLCPSNCEGERNLGVRWVVNFVDILTAGLMMGILEAWLDKRNLMANVNGRYGS